MLFNYNWRFRKGDLLLNEHVTRAMYSVTGKSKKFDLPVDLQLDLVLPVLTFACEIWGYVVIRVIKLLHLSFLKHICTQKDK